MLLIILFASPLYGFSQFVSGNVSYGYTIPLSNPISGHGFQIGVGGENLSIKNTPLKLAMRYQFLFTKPSYTARVDDITFYLPESVDNLGFADVDFKNFASEVSMDIGYQAKETSLFEPYLSFGTRFSNNVSYVSYGLYNQSSCDCYDNSPEKFTKTKSLGLTTGLGFKIRATKSFYIDLRANHLSAWRLRKNTARAIPDPTTFHIDDYGKPRFENSKSNYFSDLSLRVGLIFRINVDNSEDDTWYYTSRKKSSKRKSNVDSSSESDDNSSSGGYYHEDPDESEEPCEPVELTPTGRGGG